MDDRAQSLRSPANWLSVVAALLIVTFGKLVFGLSDAVCIPLSGILAGVIAHRLQQEFARRSAGK